MSTPDEETLVDLPPLEDDDEEVVMATDSTPAAPSLNDSARMVDDMHVANEKELSRQKQREYLGWSFRDIFIYLVAVMAILLIIVSLLVAWGFIHVSHSRGGGGGGEDHNPNNSSTGVGP